MATTFAQRSKALNLWTPDENIRLRLTTLNSGFGPEASIDFNNGAGSVLFPGTLIYVHQGTRFALGETIAALAQADMTEQTRAAGADCY